MNKLISSDARNAKTPGIIKSKKILHHNALPVLIGLILLLAPMQIVLRRGIKDVEEPLPLIADLEHARHVPAPIAVIWRAPDRAQPVVVEDLIALLAKLVRAENMRHVVHIEELLHDLGAKSIPRAPGRQGELVSFRIRIAPHQVGHGSLVWDLAEAIDDFDLVDAVDAGAQAAVDAEDLVVNDDG